MSYEGRSPMKDVARSVVLGAAMISPALLEACRNDGAPPLVPVPTVGADDDAGGMLLAVGADAAAGDPVDAGASTPPDADEPIPAPSTTVVRPRPDPTFSPQRVPMPTRGFAGGARVRV